MARNLRASLISQLHGTCIQLPTDTKIPSSAYIKAREVLLEMYAMQVKNKQAMNELSKNSLTKTIIPFSGFRSSIFGIAIGITELAYIEAGAGANANGIYIPDHCSACDRRHVCLNTKLGLQTC
ncbi:hypothetical protein HanRHA438_Chr10g0471781 [Helianthus annuus]|uniref:Uncharacterized protein n=2 Tax=Helianthus annuus TaxID=4232 RepID=A0A9K3I1C8_HELAN|nr:hypothetical protein HanXRQr2_Chr10g0458941 [Helianthus annuus]KAJ0881204.1 hypothetical protein HanRHA438_Chr10g0471781 [Helianthus annuus]KAJ0885232.1 hypothetical protein HanPSC8_Chr10g0442991 [Helianthus annuus]